MAYTKTFNPDKFMPLASHLERILELQPDERYEFKGMTSSQVVKLRWLLYDWLHHTGLKSRFRIKQIGTTTLFVLNTTVPQVKGEVVREGVPTHLDGAFREALKSPDPVGVLRQERDSGKITTAEMGQLLGELDRVKGG